MEEEYRMLEAWRRDKKEHEEKGRKDREEVEGERRRVREMEERVRGVEEREKKWGEEKGRL